MADRTLDVTLQEGMHFESIGVDGVAVELDSSPESGGAGHGWRPMELLLVGLGGCTAMDVLSILRKKRLQVDAYIVRVSGTQATEHPHIYTHISIHHLVRGTGIPESAVAHAIELSETKYCSAYAMLNKAAQISSTFEIQSEPPAD